MSSAGAGAGAGGAGGAGQQKQMRNNLESAIIVTRVIAELLRGSSTVVANSRRATSRE